MVGVQSLEHAGPHLLAPLLAERLRLLAGEAAITIGIEPREGGVAALDHLRAGHVGAAPRPLARLRRLRERAAGQTDERNAAQDHKLVHGMVPPIARSSNGPGPAPLLSRPC